jgi:NAD(P)H-dependent FMN reductase
VDSIETSPDDLACCPVVCDVGRVVDHSRLESTMTKIAIVIGSTRPGRVGAQVAGWVDEVAGQRDDATFEIVDLIEFRLPFYDQTIPPAMGGSGGPEAQAWAQAVDGFDGFVFVTAEYNQQLPAALKNAIDFVYAEWGGKTAAIVSYGVAGGAGAAAQLRQLCNLLGMAVIPAQASLHLATDFEDYSVLVPNERSEAALVKLLDHAVAWTDALAPLRSSHSVPAP